MHSFIHSRRRTDHHDIRSSTSFSWKNRGAALKFGAYAGCTSVKELSGRAGVASTRASSLVIMRAPRLKAQPPKAGGTRWEKITTWSRNCFGPPVEIGHVHGSEATRVIFGGNITVTSFC
jgi:hypothetical protein